MYAGALLALLTLGARAGYAAPQPATKPRPPTAAPPAPTVPATQTAPATTTAPAATAPAATSAGAVVPATLAPAAAATAAVAPAPRLDSEFDEAVAALYSPQGLTAMQAATRARLVAPEVARRHAEVAAAVVAAKRAELAKVPRIGVTAGYTRLSEITPPEIAPGVAFPVFFNQYSVSAQLAVPLSDYAVRIPAIIEAARLGSEAARAVENSTKVAVGAQAVAAYYDWMRTQVSWVVAKQSQKQINATLVQVRALAEVQRLSRADLLRVESQRAQIDQMVAQLASLVDVRAAQLRLAVGAPEAEALLMGEDLREEVAVPSLDQVDALVAKALGQRLDVRSLDVGMLAKEKQRNAEKAGKLPRLSAFAQLDYANPNQRIFPLKDEFNMTWAAGVQLSWTLNDYLNTDYAVKGLEAERAQLAADRARLADGIRLQIVGALSAIAVAQSALASSREALAAAEEGYRVRMELLAMQRATAVELVDAQAELTRARGAAMTARVDLRFALAQLFHALGEDGKDLIEHHKR